jgi:hypothetical protein
MEIELHSRPEGGTADEILEIVDHLTDRWFSRDVAPATRRDLLFTMCFAQSKMAAPVRSSYSRVMTV